MWPIVAIIPVMISMRQRDEQAKRAAECEKLLHSYLHWPTGRLLTQAAEYVTTGQLSQDQQCAS